MTSFHQFLLFFDLPGWLHRAQSSRQAALLSVLAIASEKKLPLGPMLDAFADDSRHGWRHGVRDLSDMLQAGTSLPDALEAVPGLLPPEALMAARTGAESGALAPALRLAADRLAGKEAAATSWAVGLLIYLAFLALVTLIVVAYVMIRVIPKFKAIFENFGTELPPLTIFVIEASEFAVTYGLLLIPLLFVLLWLALTFAAAAGRASVPLTGPFKLLARLTPRFATGDVLRNLSIAVAAGRPLVGPLSTMAGFHPALTIGRRIAAVADDVERGHDCWHAMQEAGLIARREAALLAAAERAGNLDWALLRTADSIDGRLSFRFAAVVEFVRPALILLYAVVVGTIVVALFLPIVKLLNDLS